MHLAQVLEREAFQPESKGRCPYRRYAVFRCRAVRVPPVFVRRKNYFAPRFDYGGAKFFNFAQRQAGFIVTPVCVNAIYTPAEASLRQNRTVVTVMNMNYGFVRAAALVPKVKVADPSYNADGIIELIKKASDCGADIAVFPELALTAATCGDLFCKRHLLQSAETALARILSETSALSPLVILGLPLYAGGKVYDAAVVFQYGRIAGVVPKSLLSPAWKRWFTSGENVQQQITLCGQQACLSDKTVFKAGDVCVSVRIGEDALTLNTPLRKGRIIAAPAAYPELVGRNGRVRALVAAKSSSEHNAYVMAAAGAGESTTDYVYGGASLIVEDYDVLAEGARFMQEAGCTISDIDVEKLQNSLLAESDAENPADRQEEVAVEFSRKAGGKTELMRKVNAHPFIPEDKDELSSRCREIFEIQTAALLQRLRHTGMTKIVLGISGGLDSTLSLLVAANALDKAGLPRENIYGITMPGFGTTGRTYANALAMMRALGVTIREISIKDACIRHFEDIGHDISVHDVTYENSQARERTQILMDFANKTGALHLGTGDMSELALGWATYNGDHMSMYNVNGAIPKTMVRYMVAWGALELGGEIRDTLLDVVNTPISPELMPAGDDGAIEQKTEDIVGPYELHDFFLYNFVRNGFSPAKIHYLALAAFGDKYDGATVKHWLTVFCRRFFAQQFKRSCLSDGPAVGSVGLSPRGGWSMPSDASAAAWISECGQL